MARYIDADALREELDSILNWNTNDEYNMYSDTMVAIDNAPTVDAVEVVRCKDCKYCDKHTHCDGHEYYGCGCISPCDYPEVDLNHYCGYGERREENDTD